MLERVKWIGRLVAVLVTAVVLALGTQAAFASPAQMTCPNDGFNTLGEQPSAEACQDACDAVHGEGNSLGHWNSISHCCSCLL